MNELLDNYPEKGEFMFDALVNLLKAASDVSASPGVYIFQAIWEDRKELVYIGSSGRVLQDGSMKKQMLNGRIIRPSHREKFEFGFKTLKVQSFEVRWYVTMNDGISHIPGYVEGALIQAFYDKHGQLPMFNKSF